jgi:tRNA(fMet)-specific endonuclease VapC
MGVLIDSSVLIAAERGTVTLPNLIDELEDEAVVISSVTASELLHGVHRAKTTAQKSRREAFVEHLLAELPIAPFDAVSARVHARLWAELASRGEPVGAHDLLIAATAVSLGFGVASREERSFSRIPGLRVLHW